MHLLHHQIYLHIQNSSSCTQVQPADRLGIYAQNRNPIAYRVDNSNANTLIHQADAPLQEGQDVAFRPLRSPYEFSVAAWIDPSESQPFTTTSTLIETEQIISWFCRQYS